MGWLRISLTDDEQRQVFKERESHPIHRVIVLDEHIQETVSGELGQQRAVDRNGVGSRAGVAGQGRDALPESPSRTAGHAEGRWRFRHATF